MAVVYKILEKIGKTVLHDNFRQQRVDSIDLCKSLTDDDLKELGIGTIGDRAAFRDAVNNYGRENVNVDVNLDNTSRRSMVMQMFRPSRGGSRTRGKKSHSTRTWTVQFFCLADRKASKPPKTTEKVALQKAGLGLKKVQLKCTDDEEEVLSTLVSDVGFTQLKDIGGFELLHCQSNCRTLQLITCRWSVDELKKVIGVQAKIYIRPIQKNLIVRTLNQDGSSTSLKEQCTTCGESFSLAELRQHVTLCAKDESDDDIPYDDTAQEAIEIPNSVTTDDTAPEAIEIPNSVTTIIVHGSHETAQIIHVQDPTNQDIPIIQNDDSLVSHVKETNIPEDIHVNQEETHYSTDIDIDALVKATVKYCQEKNMSDPVDILRFYRTKVVTGRKLDIEDPTEATDGETNFILVDRGRLLSSAIDEIEGITNLRLCLEVQFYGEESVDLGGPRKEFFVLALREMKEKYFNPIREWSKDYMSLGKIMALSILQNGKMPRVFPADMVQEVFCSDSEIARPVIEDIRKGLDALGIHQNGKMPRVFPADMVQEVFCSDSEIARPVIEDIRKGLDALGIHQNGKMPRVFPADMVQEVFCSDSEIARPVIEDIRKGLDALGIHQLTRKLTSLIHLFTPNAQLPITVRQLSHLLQPLFSPEGSNRRRIESAMFSNFVKYMREVASGRRESITLQSILQFATGADEEPVLGYALRPSIDFVLTRGSYLPTSNTCINRLNLCIPEDEKDMPQNDLLFGFFDYAFSNNYFGLQ